LIPITTGRVFWRAIAAAARDLDTLRNNWLNPPELVRTEVLEFPGSVGGPWDRYIDRATVQNVDGTLRVPNFRTRSVRATLDVPPASIGTVKYPRLVPKDDESAKGLKKRTLTNLYNQLPTWLAHAHRKLDAAVFAAYGWEPSLSDDELLAKLLALNLAQAQV
jgi:hypothetical protein